MNRTLYLLPIAIAAASVAMHPGIAPVPVAVQGKPTPIAENAQYDIDTMHAGITFSIRHLGLSEVHGRFNEFSGSIAANGKELSKSRVEFTAKIDSVDTGIAARDEHLRKDDMFDAAKYPTLKFVSKRVERRGDGYVAVGDLTIKDKTKEIRIPFRHFGPYRIPGMADQPERIGIVADPITIKRSDFGVADAQPFPDGVMPLSDEVKIMISIQGLKK